MRFSLVSNVLRDQLIEANWDRGENVSLFLRPRRFFATDGAEFRTANGGAKRGWIGHEVRERRDLRNQQQQLQQHSELEAKFCLVKAAAASRILWKNGNISLLLPLAQKCYPRLGQGWQFSLNTQILFKIEINPSLLWLCMDISLNFKLFS